MKAIDDTSTRIAMAAEGRSAFVKEMSRNVFHINVISCRTLENIVNALASFEGLEQLAQQLDGIVKQYWT